MASDDVTQDPVYQPHGKRSGVNRLRTSILVCLLLSLTGLAWRSWVDATTRQSERIFTATDTGQTIGYLLNLPKEYAEDDHRWPLILFLHGAGERGDDLEKVKKHGPLKYLEEHDDLPLIIVSPQASPNSGWDPAILGKLLDDVISRYPIDKDRVYVTGYSMGGGGTWSLAIAYPDRFAAIAPVCGYGDPAEVPRLKNVPVWAFHGAKDETIPLSQSENMVNALRAADGDARLTTFPEGGHGIQTQVYLKPELYHWLLSHSRKDSGEN